MAFSKLKVLLQEAEGLTVETLQTTIGKLAGDFEPGECANFLKAGAYDAE